LRNTRHASFILHNLLEVEDQNALLWHPCLGTPENDVDNGVFRISLDSLAYDPPPANLFPFMVKEFLRYSGSRFWPWTKTVREKTCCVEAGDTTVVWTMSSEDISMGLRIRRN
jgi:hypothetical protein